MDETGSPVLKIFLIVLGQIEKAQISIVDGEF